MADPHLKIGLDFDDVLVASADYTVALYNKQYGTSLTRDDWYDDPNIVAPWQVETFEDVVRRVVEVQSTEAFKDVPPLKDAQRVLAGLKEKGHELIVITGRPEQLREQTLYLMNKYYGDIFNQDALYFTNHFQHDGARLDKGGIANQLQLTHFVDDVVQHAENVVSKGVKTLLFSDNYHWNQIDCDPRVIRVGSWQEIGDYFDGQAV